MSDKPISVGDLVMVVRGKPCGCYSPHAGLPFRVARLAIADKCRYCKKPMEEICAENGSGEMCIELHRLKRIDPDALKDDVPTKEELTA